MERLAGKRAFLTAAGQGIGRAVAELFIAEGAQVIATDLRADSLQGLACQVAPLDVTDREAVFGQIRAAGPLDILFNCAGLVHHGTILECSDQDWETSFALNARSMFWTMQAALPAMLQRGRGSIVNVSSVASSVKGVPQRFLYGASKAAIIGMTKSVAADFVGQGIRCNAICPGTVDSPSWRGRVVSQARQAGLEEEQVRQAFIQRQPIGRVGRPGEIAHLALYLASDEAAFTTGAVHLIDGGWSN